MVELVEVAGVVVGVEWVVHWWWWCNECGEV